MPEVEITKPDKSLIGALTKQALADYYAQVAERMLPHLRDRPLNLERFPDGIDGKQFFTQHAPKHTPDWITTATTPKRGGDVVHVVAQDADTLRWLAQQAALTIHGWLSRKDLLDKPDRLIVDLDPGEDTTIDDLRRTAASTRERLEHLGLHPFVMTSGSRGFHITTPLKRTTAYEDVRAFVSRLAEQLAKADPDHLTTEFYKEKREGRMYVDVGRNAYGHTAVMPYSVRARPSAPVAAPLHWHELETATPQGFTTEDVPGRDDPWADFAQAARPLGEARKKISRG